MRKALMAKGLRVKRGYLGDGGIVGARWKEGGKVVRDG